MFYFYSTRERSRNPAPVSDRAARGGVKQVVVRKAFDGDSGKLADGREYRLVGIDTPEKGRQYADEARALAKKMLDGRKVFLEVATEPKDRYNRILAWMWIGEGSRRKLVNEEIIRAGLAYVYKIKPNVRYIDRLIAAQREARAAGRGVWSISVSGRIMEEYYIVSAGLTHAPNCSKMLRAKKKKTRYDTYAEALDTGAPPCRSCKLWSFDLPPRPINAGKKVDK
jgi:endonuclease YncB( thermonuclease family)